MGTRTRTHTHVANADIAGRTGQSATAPLPTMPRIALLPTMLRIALLTTLVVMLSLPLSACTSSSGTQSVSQASVSAEVIGEPDLDTLYDLISEEDVDSILEQAATNPDAAWIAANASAYDAYDQYVELKVLRLVAAEPMAAAFVRGFPENYPTDPDWVVEDDEPDYSAPGLPTGSPSPDVPNTAIPHLYQWDVRWAFTTYNGDAFGIAGCGPTSLAMVYQGLTGKTDITPYDVGKWSIDNGYTVPYAGTSNELFFDITDYLGLKVEDIPVDAESIITTLEEGRPIIASVAPGYFTSFGHFFVLAGVTDDGQVILNDPYSGTRSSQLWDPDLIAYNSYALYAYSL